jgi:hypothetical protein
VFVNVYGQARRHAGDGSRRSLPQLGPTSLERRQQQRLDALGPAPRAELPYVLRLPDLQPAKRIGDFWGHPETREFGELLIDLEEDKAARAVIFRLLAEMERK